MPVSVECWRDAGNDGVPELYVIVQLEHAGFVLTLDQVEEFCQKFDRIEVNQTCLSEEGDTLLLDVDRTSYEQPVLILAVRSGLPPIRWFCDIPMCDARLLRSQLAKCHGFDVQRAPILPELDS